MTRNVLELPDAGPEPELATGPRHDRGAGAGHALERDGAGRRAGRVPALRLGRLGASSSPRDGRPCVRSARPRLRVPEVICLAHYDRLPGAAVTFSRRNVAKRDHHTCQYCGAQPGAEAITIDHVVPRSQGGASSWTNCVAACVACNARKADRTPEQAGMKLRRRPVRPEWKPLYAAQGVRVESWARFLPHEPALLLA